MTRPPEFNYLSQYYQAWASDFWGVFRALRDDNGRFDQGLERDTLAAVAALLVVTNKLDDMWRGE